MSPVIGNIRVVLDTILSEGSYIKSADSLLVPILILSALSLLMGVLIAGLDFLETARRKKLAVLKYILCAGVVFVAVDLSYGGKEIAQSLWPFGLGIFSFWHEYRLWLLICALIVFLGIYALCRALQNNLGILMVSIFGAVFVSTLVIFFHDMYENKKPEYAVAKGRADLPPVIHIIIDEMIGAEGIDRSLLGGEATYQLVRKFHERFNFRLYGKAFSRHMASHMSIPNMLNYDFTDKTPGSYSKYLSQGKWKYLENMQNRGYDINVYQTTHINFCNSGNITKCKTLHPFNPASIYISPPKEYKPSSLPKNSIVIGLLLQQPSRSYSSYIGFKFIARIAKDWYFAPRYDVQSFNLWFDEYSNDVVEAKDGNMFFAHFLAPHEPFILNQNCETRPVWKNRYFLKEHEKLEGDAFREARKAYYRDYYQQVACVFKKLTEFMENIEKLQPFKHATIIIHGDHGSRISSGQYYENLSERDFVDNFSTLFSIRSLKVKPGYDLRSVSIHRLFAEIFSSQYNEASAGEIDTVSIISREAGRVVAAPMPDFGIPSLTTGE